MIIRTLTENDLTDLSKLYEQFWGERSAIEKMRSTFRRLKKNPNYIFLAAENDGRLAGSVMGIICEELYGECRPFMVMEDVIVDEQHRRSGVGSALMRELEKIASGYNCAFIIFVTETERIAAQRFYESLGYKPDAHKGFKKRLNIGV